MVKSQAGYAEELVAELGTTASYLSQAEMVLTAEHDWVRQAQDERKKVLEKLAATGVVEISARKRLGLG